METNTNAVTPEAMIAQLRAMRQQIPEYAQLTTKQARAINSVASLPPALIVAAANALGESATVQGIIATTADELRQQTADDKAWTALEEELAAMYRGVATANRVRRHRTGTIALQTYAVSRALVRRAEHSDLLPHVDSMHRAIRFGRQPKPAQPQPSPEAADAITN